MSTDAIREVVAVYVPDVRSGKESGAGDFHGLADGFARSSIGQPSDRSFHLDVVDAINFIVESGEEAILPYGWGEAGEYHLDIFK